MAGNLKTGKSKALPAQPTWNGDEGRKNAPKSEDRDPTTFEVVQIAALLATSKENQGKSVFEVTQQAMAFWKAARDFRKAQDEKRILLATVARMTDGDGCFEHQVNPRRKGPPQIYRIMWYRRLRDYPGNKRELFSEFVFAARVPAEKLLKELFPSAAVPRQEQMKRLLTLAPEGWGKSSLYDIALMLTQPKSDAEIEILHSAIHTDQPGRLDEFCQVYGFDDLFKFLLGGVINDAKSDCSRFSSGSAWQMHPLLCRPLISMRQEQISGIKANAARKNANRSFAD